MKRILLTIYLCILLILTTYQDFTLVNSYGEVFRTPIPLLVPIFLIVEFIIIIKKRSIICTQIQKYFAVLVSWIILVSLVLVCYFYIIGMYNYLDENLFNKAFKGFTYFILILLYMRHLYFIFSKLNNRFIGFSFILVITLLNIILIVEYFTMPNALLFLHSNPSEYNRIRLLTAESSWTGTIYVIYCSISLYLSKLSNKKFHSIYIILSFISFSLISESKGFLVVAIISIIPFFFKRMNVKHYLYIIVALIFVGTAWNLYFSEVFKVHFMSDIQNYTSISTRMGLVFSAINIFFFHPFGVGTGAYIYYLANKIPDIFPWLDYVFNMLFSWTPNKSELVSLSQETAGLSVKSGMFQWILIGGIFSIIFFWRLYRYFKENINDFVLTYSLYFIALSTFFYVSFDIKYEIWLYFSFIDSIVINQKYKDIKKI